MRSDDRIEESSGNVSIKQLFVSSFVRSIFAGCILAISIMSTTASGWNLGSLFSKPRKDTESTIVGKFFDEIYAGNGFQYAYPESSEVSIVQGSAKSGKASVRFRLAADDYSGGSICLNDKVLALRPFLKTGALQFWIRGIRGNEKAWVALVDEEKSDGRKTVVRLPIEWFGGIKADWSFISIPIENFGEQGVYWDAKDNREADNPFDWDKVAEFRIESKKGENPVFEVQVDDIVFVNLQR